MERTITKIEKASRATQLVFLDSETGEETRRMPIEYHYTVYYSTPNKPNNYRHIVAYDEEQALLRVKQAFARTDANYAKRTRGANQCK